MNEKSKSEEFTEQSTLTPQAPALFSRWLPPGLGRKLILAFFLGMGCFGVSEGRYLWSLYWLVAMTFSPRMVGHFVRGYGGLMKKINHTINRP
ncbi:hypothetical protein [Polynucleobacter sp. IMCC 29146]|uniref:hypothetical protein n=1 Tax=Polynucleobacter sp. IMCC 29146 TaxID=2780953 RepID=UPI001F3A1FDC|nr:hypothetical protein [Polynucleobacter sp. IMCC 29146]MCE7529542.1 hypothetical protein [Polynucleobacter sp. IMCC 29146]